MTTSVTKKWVYLFEEGNAQMRDLLGGKGAGLAEMTNAGLPVPPGFTITTEACRAYYTDGKHYPEGMWEQVLEGLRTVEQRAGKKLGDSANPLLVSVRSGAKFSMPGMMDTVLNLGLSDQTLQGVIQQTTNERFAYDAYRRFIQMFGRIVLGIDGGKFEEALEHAKKRAGALQDTDLTADDLMGVVQAFKGIVRKETGKDFPQDPLEQLRLAIDAVFRSWNTERAIAYRNFHKIPNDLGTAVNVVTMVFGNMGNDSGTGVAFTRDPSTGERVLFGEYLTNAQGEDVVAGIRTPKKIAELERDIPDVYRQFKDIAERLERHYRDAQDLEFTVERRRLYMLQTRSAKRTAQAAVKIAVEMVKEGMITRDEALQRVEPNQIYQLLLPQFDPNAKQQAVADGRLLATGLNASPGAATGQVVFNADRAAELGERGVKVILVRPETNPDDVKGMLVAVGVLTARGGATSHAAVVARGLGKPCVAGAEALDVRPDAHQFSVDGRVVHEDEQISIDGTTGEIFLGTISTVPPGLSPELRELLSWADERRSLGVWANADYPRDAMRAVEFGAEGIGLCRTEHMFFEEERLPIVRRMILAAADATRALGDLADASRALKHASSADRPKLEEQLATAQRVVDESEAVKDYLGALAQLQEIQKGDFIGIFRAMHGRPVVVRLLDPPLHEFLPRHDELLVEVTEAQVRGDQSPEAREREELLHAVESLREANPMLGLRGCRLGILYPQINEMQVRAILTAAAELTQAGVAVHPEIMIPLISHVNELKAVRDQLESVARAVEQEQGTKIPYKFGTMIEIPRAALTAGEIAQYAEFFSFGTNDLTQTAYGYSRDDAEGKFLLHYVEKGILPVNPFQVLDQTGVGRLIEIAVTEGRRTRPDLKIGICGEHGGEPTSIAFSHNVGLTYVSCSPYRVPVARLAAAQAALAQAALLSTERDR